MPTVASILQSNGYKPSNVVRAVAGEPFNTTFVVQGLGAVQDHWLANLHLIQRAGPALLQYMGDLSANVAKEILRTGNHILSSDTFDSTSVADGGVKAEGFGKWSIEYGAETQQSIFLEFGFVHQPDRNWIRYPFIIPAAEATRPVFEQAVGQIAEVMLNRRRFDGDARAAMGSVLDTVRSDLYTFSKFAGDVQALGFGGFRGARGAAVTSARLIGDMQSVFRNSIARRLTVRSAGSFASQGLRAQVTSTITGPSSAYQGAAQRIFNRVSGRVTGRELSEF